MIKIGGIISSLRKKQNLTVTKLAEKISLSVGYVSQIERDLVSPSLATLEKIAIALDVPINIFFKEQYGIYSYVKKDERKKISHKGNTWSYPVDNSKTNAMECYIMTNDSADQAFHTYKGVKFFYMLEGESSYFIGSKEYLLKEGDSLYFDASLPHWCNAKSTVLRKTLVISIPAENTDKKL